MYDWRLQFSRHTLKQGRDYFEQGRVVDLQEQEGIWTAGVLEKQRYDVRMAPRKEKEGYLMNCRCPMAGSGAKCKHMAAVLFAMENRQEQGGAYRQMSLADMLEASGLRETVAVSEEAPGGRKEEASGLRETAAVSEEVPGGRKEEAAGETAAVWEEAPGGRKEEAAGDGISEEERAGYAPAGASREYIVLNRQEEEEDELSETRRAAFLAPYQYFDFDAIEKSMHLTVQKTNRSRELLTKGAVKLGEMNSGYCDGSENIVAEAMGEGQQGKSVFSVHIMFGRAEMMYAECGCEECRRHYYYRFYRREYCVYVAALLALAKEDVGEKRFGDATDKLTARFLYAVSQRQSNHIVSDAVGRSASLTLLPRLCRKKGELSVSFKVGEDRLFVVKDLFQFYEDVRESRSSTYGSSTQINHRRENFTEEGKDWVDYIGRIVREEQDFNRRLIEAEDCGKAASRHSEFSLFGWRLDEFFQKLGSAGVDYEERDSGKKEKKKLYPKEQNPKITLTIRKNKMSSRRLFHGVEVDGRMPLVYEGGSTSYYIEENGLCRMEEDFARRIRTLAEFCRGEILHFEVGRNHLGQFYYHVLPQLEEVAQIVEEDRQSIETYLPPKPHFTFYLDAEEHDMNCRISVRYGDRRFALLELEEETDPIRDKQREGEIIFWASQLFPQYDPDRQELSCGRDEELMYRVLEQGVDMLLSLGEVQCTQRFRGVNMGKRVRVTVGVSVARDLLNLEISTQDTPPGELLDILKSYRAKRKYHRLKNGDFLSLEDPALEALDEMMSALRLSPKELLRGKVDVPLYRALYLDKLLEKNQEIYSNRDGHFREMVKNFKAVKDADFEVPESLKGVLRGYQRLGYRWLRLLEEYRLGGILADDMGLGKTLQVIAVLLAAKKEGRYVTSLIVAPASLVYNWGEELKRFAPELSCCFITGDQEERAQKLEQYRSFDVVVTSYDLLKRDIANYEDREFHYQVIDEAQYIKNHTTAAARAVKGIRSRVRYALTGTPVENRLSELWSIFDYLIPGYLYGYDVFRSDFETPIVKGEDQAALERLQRMAAPFILRRLKEDVLKDLPEKLEENRYVKFDGEQQRLYDAQVVKMRGRLAAQDAETFRRERFQILAELMRLRQICCDPGLCFENYRGESTKLEACVELIKSAVEGGHKILLFSQFTTMLSLLAKRLDEESLGFYAITGETPKEKRLQLVKSFNEDETPVFLISLKAGGVGLNLTGADVVIHYDPWWNVAVQNQATDRAHRIGQTRKVVVYRLIAKNTIEEKIQQLQESKKALSDQVVQGSDGRLEVMSREDFLSLLA